MRFFRRAKVSEEAVSESVPESTPSDDNLDPSIPYESTVNLPSEVFSEPTTAASEPDTSRPARTRRPWLPFVINWPAMFLIVALVAFTVAALLFNEGALSDAIVAWWPLAVMAPAALWFLVALLSRDAHGLLGSAALFGVSASLLLASQKVDLLPTIVGITFIAIGAGIMLRGLLLRNQPIT